MSKCFFPSVLSICDFFDENSELIEMKGKE